MTMTGKQIMTSPAPKKWFFSTITKNISLLIFSLGVLTITSFPQGMEIASTSEKQVLFDNKEIVQKQLDLIKDSELTVWGIGLLAGDDITSGFIRKVTDSSWSHVALILKDQTNSKYCFESTGNYDAIMHHGMLPQVQISRWDLALKNYSGVVAQREFTLSIRKENNPETVGKLVRSLIGRSYETNLISLIEAINSKNKKADLSSLFCSELVAMVLQNLGYLDNTKLSDNYLPCDFSTEVHVFMNGAVVGDEILLKGNILDKGECLGSCCTGCVIL